jgi:MinD superfamily P-loop ATPase
MKIAIASGKGGTGKTFISTNLFWSAQKAGIPVTLIDCDAEEPNVREFIQATAYDQKVLIKKYLSLIPKNVFFVVCVRLTVTTMHLFVCLNNITSS